MSFNNLFKLLNDKHISSKTLSENTGISTGNISDWKSGRSMPTSKKLIIIADYLDCSIDYLLERTDNPKVYKLNEPITSSKNVFDTSKIKSRIIPLYLTRASAGTGSWLSDDVPFQYMTVPQNDKTANADLMIKVTGDSMQPRFFNDDVLLIKKTPAIVVGEIGIFIVNGDSYVKKMGNGELISLNSKYDNIKLTEFDDISCVGKVIDTIVLDNYS